MPKNILLLPAALLLPPLLALVYVFGWLPHWSILVAVLCIVAAIEAAVVLSLVFSDRQAPSAPVDPAQVLYADRLITITPDRIVFHHYGLFGASRDVLLDRIRKVTAVRPSLRTGKWRIHGTGDFHAWYPKDWRRPKRDTIFQAVLTGQGSCPVIGFTVEDSRRVREVLEGLKLLGPVCPKCGYDLESGHGSP